MKFLVAFLGSMMLVACGGGGGSSTSSGPVASTLSFPLRAGVNADTAMGGTTLLTAIGTPATQVVDGMCSGTLSGSSGQATGGATFEGSPALSSVGVVTMSFTNCSPSTSTATVTVYFDTNYVALGSIAQGGNYGVYLVAPSVPVSVKVGDTGSVGTRTYYTDSTKTVGAGHSDETFVVEPDTANTAIVNQISKSYDAASQLQFTSQDRYRITSTGALTEISLDIQYAPPLTTHLVFRK